MLAPADTTSLVLHRETLRNRGLRLAALALAVLLVWGGVLTYLGAEAVDKGWARYYGLSTSPPDFALGCMSRTPCRQALMAPAHARLVRLPLYTLPALAAALLLVGLLVYARAGHVRPSKLPGAARFRARWRAELAAGLSYLGHKEGVLLRYPGDLRFRHTLVVGSTGVGKTTRVIRPMLLMCAAEGRSAVVFDLKYPDRSLLECVLAFEGYGHEVMLLLPYEPNSPRLPLLKGAEDPRLAMELADVVIPIKEREDSTTYYKDIERKLLATLINIEALYGEGSLGRIADLCERGHKEVHQHVQTYAPDAERRMGFFWQLSDSDQAKMIAGLAGRLSVFSHPYLNRSTSFGPGEIDLSRIGRRPTLFYLGINQRYLMGGAGQLYLQLVKRYLDRTLLEEAERQGGRLRVGVEVYLDEFTNLGYLPYMSDNLSTMRSRGVGYVITLQSYNQGLERYTKEEVESIMANANTWILFGAGMSDLDAQRFSKSLGMATMYEQGESVSTPHLLAEGLGSFNQNYKVAAVPLLAPEELRALPPEQAVVRFGQGDPLVADFPRLDEMLRGGASPLMRRLARWFDGQVRRLAQGGSDALTRPYLLPPEEAPAAENPRQRSEQEELVEWAAAMLRAGAAVREQKDPDTLRPTKLAIVPIGGQPPYKAQEWERARWVKLEKGRTVVSLVNDGLALLLQAEGPLVAWAGLRARLVEYAQGAPDKAARRGEWLLLAPEALDELGLTVEALEAAGGRRVRQANRRGFVEFPLVYTAPEAA